MVAKENEMGVGEILQCAIAEYDSRDSTYGETWRRTGEVYAAMFPEGITLGSAEEFQRYQMFSLAFGKLIRYANNLASGGHEDSALDLINYAAMLRHATTQVKEVSTYQWLRGEVDIPSGFAPCILCGDVMVQQTNETRAMCFKCRTLSETENA